MQAWDNVKVKNEASEYAGRAGVVVRVEKKGDTIINEVRLDEAEGVAAEVVAFDDTELTLLGR